MSSHPQPPPHLSADEAVRVVRRRKWLVIQSVLIVAVVAVVLSIRQSSVYEASSGVLLSRQSLTNIATGLSSPDVFADPTRYAETQAGLARSLAVARRALKLAPTKGTSAESLLANSTVRPDTNADLLQFSVRDGEPAVSAKLAYAYARAFTDYRYELDTSQLKQARAEIEEIATSLRRNGETSSPLYRDLVSKAQQLRTAELLQSRNLVVSRPTQGSKIAPTPRRSAVLGALLGLLLGIVAAFVVDRRDRRIRDDEELISELALPLLARIPMPPEDASARGPVILHHTEHAYADAIRRLRTNLQFANPQQAIRTVMFGSAMPAEGKSTTLANLAVSLANAGKDVIVADLDVRDPSMARMFGITTGRGITDVVAGRINAATALVQVQTVVEGLSLSSAARRSPKRGRETVGGRLRVLAVGARPTVPGEFVSSPSVVAVLQELREQCDYLLVDVPPLVTVGDAVALSACMDGIILVARLGMLDHRMVNDLKREIARMPVAKIGLVVTDVNDLHDYGYEPESSEPESAEQETLTTPERARSTVMSVPQTGASGNVPSDADAASPPAQTRAPWR